VPDESEVRSAALRLSGDDADMVGRLRGGDEAAFMSLVERHGPAMVRLASMHVPRPVAEEVVQDAWLGVLQGIGGFEGRSSLKTWIFSILMNRVRTQAQREQRSIPFSALGDGADDEPGVDPGRFFGADHAQWPHHWAVPPESWGESAEDRLLSAEVQEEIRRAIDALPRGPRDVITLCDVEGWTADEVCDLLDITPANQRVLLHRARTKVRTALERYFAGGVG
jgi:RNA polymerase sigma-70 factor, ECF subfamily